MGPDKTRGAPPPPEALMPSEFGENSPVLEEAAPDTLEGAIRVLQDDGSVPPEVRRELPDSLACELYRWMVITRAFDERCMNLQRQGRISFFVTSTGQEAAHVGSAAALEPTDWIFPAYREPAAALMRGVPLRALVDQIVGNAADTSRGRQMPCHYSFPDARYASISSPIGTQITQAVGAALAARLRGDRIVALAYFGDGATSSNDFHSGLNFAGVYQAPVVFVCQNNHWAISMPVRRQTASDSIAIKSRAYGFPGCRVDGNDLPAVLRVTREAVARARGGGGPTLIEAVTYRMHSHTTADDATRYRNREEVEAWRRRDPIGRFRRHLVWRGIWSTLDDEALWAESKLAVARAIEEAERTPPPDVATLFDDVYASMPASLREQRDALLDYLKKRSTLRAP